MHQPEFHFPFEPVSLRKGGIALRPMLSVRLEQGSQKLDTRVLLDSGADHSIIPRPMASYLGVDLKTCPRAHSNSISGKVKMGVQDLKVTIFQHENSHPIEKTMRIPFQIPLRTPGFPVCPLMGREQVFRLFDVTFRMGHPSPFFTLRPI